MERKRRRVFAREMKLPERSMKIVSLLHFLLLPLLLLPVLSFAWTLPQPEHRFDIAPGDTVDYFFWIQNNKAGENVERTFNVSVQTHAPEMVKLYQIETAPGVFEEKTNVVEVPHGEWQPEVHVLINIPETARIGDSYKFGVAVTDITPEEEREVSGGTLGAGLSKSDTQYAFILVNVTKETKVPVTEGLGPRLRERNDKGEGLWDMLQQNPVYVVAVLALFLAFIGVVLLVTRRGGTL